MKLSDNSEDYIFDYRYHPPEDFIHIYNRKIYISEIKSVVSYFGYEFNEDTSSRQRTDFLHYLNGIGNNRIRDYQLRQFIEHPLNDLHKKINMYSIDCFVYPLSGRSKLFQRMIEVIGDYTSRDIKWASYQLVKSAPVDSAFDLDRLKGNKILIVDDMNTSGSTLEEIVRILGTVNNNCEIYIYTLIGSNN